MDNSNKTAKRSRGSYSRQHMLPDCSESMEQIANRVKEGLVESSTLECETTKGSLSTVAGFLQAELYRLHIKGKHDEIVSDDSKAISAITRTLLKTFEALGSTRQIDPELEGLDL